MEQVYMPLKEYYGKYLKEAKDNDFIWVLSLLSRAADTKKVYQDIETTAIPAQGTRLRIHREGIGIRRRPRKMLGRRR
jgi:hypothetical protein